MSNIIRISSEDCSGWKNKKGTDSSKNWKEHWEEIVERKFPQKCSVEGCQEDAEVGGHMLNPKIYGETEWIVPLCKGCNNAPDGEVFDLKIGTIIVSPDAHNTRRLKRILKNLTGG